MLMADMSKESIFISSVVYFRENISKATEFLNVLAEIMEENFTNYEIILVDDCSSENITEVILEFSRELSGSVTIVRMSYPQGIQASMNAGVDIAIGDFVYEFEQAVLDFDKSLIKETYIKELEGYDVVSAVPTKGISSVSKAFYRIFNRGARTMYPLNSERFRLVSRRAINRIEMMSDSITYRKAFYMNSGLKCASIYYSPLNIRRNKSLPEERSKLAVDSLILFTTTAHRLSFAMTVTMMLFTVLSGGYTLAIFIMQEPVPGWTTMMMLMSLAFFGVFAILTIIIKYLSVLIELTFNKSRYIVEKVYKVN